MILKPAILLRCMILKLGGRVATDERKSHPGYHANYTSWHANKRRCMHKASCPSSSAIARLFVCFDRYLRDVSSDKKPKPGIFHRYLIGFKNSDESPYIYDST
jgi:hypothetical protein